jgi:hypothetical protein
VTLPIFDPQSVTVGAQLEIVYTNVVYTVEVVYSVTVAVMVAGVPGAINC